MYAKKKQISPHQFTCRASCHMFVDTYFSNFSWKAAIDMWTTEPLPLHIRTMPSSSLRIHGLRPRSLQTVLGLFQLSDYHVYFLDWDWLSKENLSSCHVLLDYATIAGLFKNLIWYLKRDYKFRSPHNTKWALRSISIIRPKINKIYSS